MGARFFFCGKRIAPLPPVGRMRTVADTILDAAVAFLHHNPAKGNRCLSCYREPARALE